MIYAALLMLAVAGVLIYGAAKGWPGTARVLLPVSVLAVSVALAIAREITAGVTVAVLAGLAWLVWFVLFSGRVRTATPQFRGRLMHLLFAGFFSVYALGIALWLIAGFIAAVTGHNHALHERMHAYGGASSLVRVEASDIAPFSIDRSSRIREVTLRAGTRTTIEFTNSTAGADTACVVVRCTAEDHERGFVSIEHNFSIYRTSGEAIFTGTRTYATIDPSLDEWDQEPYTITETFTAPAEGTYAYRCDLHPLAMRGAVRVLPPTVPLTDPDNVGFRDNARRIAEVAHEAEDVTDVVTDYGFSFVTFGLGVFLVLLRPRERMARVFGVAMIGTAAAYNLQSHAALAVAEQFEGLHVYLHPITGITYIYALVLFPDGHLVPRFGGRYIRIGYRLAFFVATMVFLGVTGSILPDFNQHPAALVLTFGMAIPVIGMIAQGYRLRRAPSSEARQQSRLLLIALAASTAVGVIVLLALGIDLGTLIDPTNADPTKISAADARAFRAFQPVFFVIPLALFFGILRYRLWDIDLVVRRTLVYGALAGFIGAAYIGIVVGLGGAIGGRTGLSIATTVVVAVAFDPLRARLQRLANRLVYGERATPYDVMAGLSHRLAGMRSAEQVLPAAADEVARALGAERVLVRLQLPNGTQEATSPLDADPALAFDRTIELTHQGEVVGELAIAKRPGDPLRAAENRLLRAIGSQVALAMHGLRLAERLRGRLADLERTTEQLEASRRRIVDAQDGERIRLERDIRERVESRLVSIADTVASAGRSKGPQTVDLLTEAAGEANEVQDTLRELARGVFPSLLSDKGVASALESVARRVDAPVVVRATGSRDRFDPNAEAAVYFCCIEAIRSAARRAGRTRIDVELAIEDDWVQFAVRDTVHGLTTTAMTGHDLQAIVDRIEAVGGWMELRSAPEGTTVAGRVPAQPFAAAQMAASLSGSNADFVA